MKYVTCLSLMTLMCMNSAMHGTDTVNPHSNPYPILEPAARFDPYPILKPSHRGSDDTVKSILDQGGCKDTVTSILEKAHGGSTDTVTSILEAAKPPALSDNSHACPNCQNCHKTREKMSNHVLKIVAKSKTWWRRSEDWKEKIQKKGAIVHTSFLTKKGDAYFELKNNDGIIEVNTTLTNTQVLTAQTADQEQHYRDQARKEPTTLSDFNDHTQCKSTMTASFDEKTHCLTYVVNSECTTNMQCDAFKAAMEIIKP